MKMLIFIKLHIGLDYKSLYFTPQLMFDNQNLKWTNPQKQKKQKNK